MCGVCGSRQGMGLFTQVTKYSKSYLEISKAEAPACLVPRDRLVRSASKFDKQLETTSYSLKSKSIGRRDYVNPPNIKDDIL
jgi:hypothetical protein